MSNEPDIEFKVYNRLTRAEESNNRSQKWTLNLFLCCLVVATGSLQFGFNIASMNSVTPVLKNFTYTNFYLFAEYHNQMTLVGYLFGNKTRLEKGKQDYEDAQIEYFSKVFGSTNKTYIDDFNRRKAEKEEFYLKNYNMSIPKYLEASQARLDEKMAKYEENKWRLEEGRQKVEKATNILWTVTNCLFVIGGMIGTFTGKLVMDLLGRKNAIFVHHMFSIVSGALVLSTPLLLSPVCMMVSRLLYGIQGGMSCTLIPTYLSEISPAALRGQTGVIHQLCITIGIVIAQVLGMRQLLGTDKLWHLLIAGPCVPAVVGALFLMMFMPESPRALLAKDKDSTRSALAFLRNTEDVEDELDDLVAEAKCGGDKESDSEQMVSVFGLFRHRDSRMAIITSLVLHMVQQLSGINAVFFYSSSIFKDAGISAENIQYAILSTGIVNVLTTIVCVPLIDRLGRKPLLVYPMLFIILDFVCLILLLKFKGESAIMSYLSIVCIMLFVMCFAIGLGPIPFIYTAECFRQNARSSAMALSTLFNWSAGLLLTLVFPFMLDLIQQYVFLVFSAIIALALAMIVIKVPETKGKSIEEIIAKFTQFKSDY